jgi:hypothetical protein
MAYYIFLKSLRSLEVFRKNPHVKIPPKSPSTHFQSLGKFKNPIFNTEILFLAFGPADPATRSASGPASPPAAPSPPAKIVPASRLSLVSLSTGPHLSDSPPSPRRPTPVGNHPRHQSLAPLPRASDAPELLQPSLITLPP